MARLAFILLMLTLPFSAAAQSVEGNPLMGRQIATTLCVPCHQIGELRRDGAPSFVDIANMSSTTALSLKVFLRSNHNRMPNLIIPDAETDDLIAYHHQSQAAVGLRPEVSDGLGILRLSNSRLRAWRGAFVGLQQITSPAASESSPVRRGCTHCRRSRRRSSADRRRLRVPLTMPPDSRTMIWPAAMSQGCKLRSQ